MLPLRSLTLAGESRPRWRVARLSIMVGLRVFGGL